MPSIITSHSKRYLTAHIIRCWYFTVLITIMASLWHHSLAQGWQWIQTSRGSHLDAWATAADRAGNAFAAGDILMGIADTTVFGPIALPAYGDQVAWAKYSPSGAVLWAGTTSIGEAWLNNIATDTAGNLLVYGITDGFSLQIGDTLITDTAAWFATRYKYFIAKFSPAGRLIWIKTDGINAYSWSVPPIVADSPALISDGGITTDRSGNIYISGNFRDSITIGTHTFYSAGKVDVFVAKYSPSGTLLWANAAGGPGNEYTISVAATPSGKVYLCGYLDSASFTVGSSVISDPYSPKARGFIAEFSPTGSPVWGQGAGGPQGSLALGVTADDYENVYMTGGFGDTSITFGSATLTRSYPEAVPRQAMFLVKYSPANTVTWSKTIGCKHANAFGFNIALAPCGRVWVSGKYMDTALIDTALLLPPPGYPPFSAFDWVFIAGYDLSGGVVGYAELSSGGDDENGIACDPTGNVFVCSDLGIGTTYIAGDTVYIPYTSMYIAECLYIAKYAAAATDSTFHSTDTSICSSGTDSITISPPGGYYSYTWNDGSYGATHTFHTPGTYWAYAVTCGHVLVDTFHLTETGIADTTASRYDTTVCKLGDLSVPVALSAPADGISYHWSTGDTTVTDTIPVFVSGVYWVSYIAHCAYHTDTFVVTVMPLPSPINGRDSICTGSTALFTDSVAGGRWSASDTSVASINSGTGIATGVAAGTCAITYTLPGGCFVTKRLKVLPLPCIDAAPGMPHADDVSIFPVPAQNELAVTITAGSYHSITIRNLPGETLIHQSVTGTHTLIDIARLPAGMYLVTLQGNDKTVVKKFVKE